MISPILIVLLVIFGSHISDWLPIDSLQSVKTQALASHCIILASLFVMGSHDSRIHPQIHGFMVILCWLMIIMFAKVGKYATVSILVALLCHQITFRYIAYLRTILQTEETERKKTRLRTLTTWIEILLVSILVLSSTEGYTATRKTTNIRPWSFFLKHVSRDSKITG